MRNLLLAYIYGLFILTPSFLLTITVRGYQISIAYCLLIIGTVSFRNMPMHYAKVFKGCKNDKFLDKNYDIFLMFAQNTDRGYTLELH